MGTDVERYTASKPIRLSPDELKFIQNSELVPKQYRGKPADIFACVLLGRQLGISDMHALRSIYVVDGKATIGAELMVTLIRQRGHSITAEYGDGQVTATGRRVDNGDEMSVTWTTAMAQRAGLLSKNNWKGYPEAMLWARAVSQLGRMLFADVLTGLVYTPDEAELSPEDRVNEAIGELSPPPDTHAPDDTPRTAPVAPTEPSDDDIIEGHPVLVDDEPSTESEGELEVAAAVPAVSPAAQPPAVEPGSPSDVPATDADGQGSIFEQMAETAQRGRRKGVADG